MKSRPSQLLLAIFALLTISFTCVIPGAAQAADPSNKNQEPIKALLVTGGCCHDYENQKKIISEALSASVGPIDWTIVDYDDKKDTQADIYKQAGWIKDFDIVLHNECFGGVEDGEFVQSIVDAHVQHKIPAIVVHCSMHSYRNAPTADSWRKLLGVTSRRHESTKHPLNVVPTDEGKASPIGKAIGDSWTTPNGELYIIENVWPTTTVLATVYSKETNSNQPIIWTNTFEGVRVFGTSLGHHNETMESETWQGILASGWEWALAKE